MKRSITKTLKVMAFGIIIAGSCCFTSQDAKATVAAPNFDTSGWLEDAKLHLKEKKEFKKNLNNNNHKGLENMYKRVQRRMINENGGGGGCPRQLRQEEMD